jgi:hypothetical protein
MGQASPLELQGTENWRSQEGAGDRLSPSVNPAGGLAPLADISEARFSPWTFPDRAIRVFYFCTVSPSRGTTLT